ncbi:MAG: hypothetical protein NVS4B11_31920 [Ktedonobacteraceae bacterium]
MLHTLHVRQRNHLKGAVLVLHVRQKDPLVAVIVHRVAQRDALMISKVKCNQNDMSLASPMVAC